ncbi:hypothetical protein U5A82_00690 [Sphingobium sp. CR2-8]|uniref:hypothetical protein n=1 Tax=Sphingobium sp. CR2-8 TaxID=1306534 RepID=UPI002DBF55AF|nr:hypothetical protein [Sphingobium sp. CR2-8]MEC3909038.1 hypothetical protein [Sphingobium sp. CR2-8]
MRILTLIAISAMSIATVTPALAQDAMMKGGMKSDKMMTMSAADTKKMKMCQAMPHDKMMKNAGCMKMSKMHPDMMKADPMAKGKMMTPGH